MRCILFLCLCIFIVAYVSAQGNGNGKGNNGNGKGNNGNGKGNNGNNGNNGNGRGNGKGNKVATASNGMPATSPCAEARKKQEACAVALGYTGVNIKEMRKNNDPKLGCIQACIYRNDKIFVNNKIDKPAAFLSMKANGMLEAEVKYMLEICTEAAEKETEECAKASLFSNCLRPKKAKEGSLDDEQL